MIALLFYLGIGTAIAYFGWRGLLDEEVWDALTPEAKAIYSTSKGQIAFVVVSTLVWPWLIYVMIRGIIEFRCRGRNSAR